VGISDIRSNIKQIVRHLLQMSLGCIPSPPPPLKTPSNGRFVVASSFIILAYHCTAIPAIKTEKKWL
jgi:hypothetical protein